MWSTNGRETNSVPPIDRALNRCSAASPISAIESRLDTLPARRLYHTYLHEKQVQPDPASARQTVASAGKTSEKREANQCSNSCATSCRHFPLVYDIRRSRPAPGRALCKWIRVQWGGAHGYCTPPLAIGTERPPHACRYSLDSESGATLASGANRADGRPALCRRPRCQTSA